MNLQYVKPDHWLSYGPNKAKLVIEGNVVFTRSLTIAPRRKTVSVGLLAIARYEYGAPEMTHFYWELGWGLQQASDSSSDLDSELNSTLVGGAGIIFQGTEGLHLGVRYLHASNAGTKGRNKGQNQLHLMLGFRL